MPQPTGSAQYLNLLLTNVAVGAMQDPANFVAARVFADVPVEKQSSRYAVYNRGDFFRDEMQRRGPASESAGGGYRVSTDPYNCEVWSLHKDVDEQTRANASDPFRPDSDAAKYLAAQSLLRQEVEFGLNFFTTGLWTGSTTGTDLVGGTDFTVWNDASSTPIEFVEEQMVNVESNSGFLPNVLVLSRRAWIRGLKNHPDIVDRVKHTNPNAITTDQVARLMGLDEIIVGAAVRNTAQEGLTANIDYVLGNHALLAYRSPAPSLDAPSAGYTFRWTGLDGVEGLGLPAAIRTIDMPLKRAVRHEIDVAFDMKVVAADTGVFLSGVVS